MRLVVIRGIEYEFIGLAGICKRRDVYESKKKSFQNTMIVRETTLELRKLLPNSINEG